jgi:archaemetzincin
VKIVIAFLCVFSIVQPGCKEKNSKLVIAIQPIGSFETALVDTICEGMKRLYSTSVVVLDRVELPEMAYYQPRNRYRADKLLTFLDNTVDTVYTKVLGITEVDISTTKGEYYDWGIFGLGSLGGRTCVVSTYRLGRNKVPYSQFVQRLVKVVNHELGHTFGLDHCPKKGCLMEDAKGSIKTVDEETGDFCSESRDKIKEVVQ